jgi:hypothetical protein
MRMHDKPAVCAAEFHRRRADDEMEQALACRPLSVALCHLKLATLHRERSAALSPPEPLTKGRAFYRAWKADKEG